MNHWKLPSLGTLVFESNWNLDWKVEKSLGVGSTLGAVQCLRYQHVECKEGTFVWKSSSVSDSNFLALFRVHYLWNDESYYQHDERFSKQSNETLSW